jgi:hypothetical protein
METGAVSGRRLDPDCAAKLTHALLNANQTESGVGALGRVEADSVVDDSQFCGTVPVRKLYGDMVRMRVFGAVGERFLHNPVDIGPLPV